MIPIICIDNSGGILFNNRRVSKDSVLIAKILEMFPNSKIWVRAFSKDLFPEDSVCVNDDCINIAAENELCFLEDVDLKCYQDKFSKIIVCKWNRDYPSDFKFDQLAFDGWGKTIIDEFKGYSHENITIEEWSRV